MTLSIFASGFMLGAGFIAAIGSQNAFVLRQGLQKRFVGPVTALCILSDAFLILLGTLGVGTLLKTWPWLTPFMSGFGALFLTLYGVRSGYSALRPRHASLHVQAGATTSLRNTLLLAAAFTFLNPHVYLDTVILLGSLASTYHGMDRTVFAIGAMSASLIWFIGLGYGARLLAPLFAQPLAWRILDMVICISMLLIATRLWFTAFAAVWS